MEEEDGGREPKTAFSLHAVEVKAVPYGGQRRTDGAIKHNYNKYYE